MAFSAPNKIPSFTDPNRRREDLTWAAAGMNAATNRVGEFASKVYGERQLPLYKDKPYYSATVGRRRGWMRKKRSILLGVVVLAVIYLFGFSSRKDEVLDKVMWKGKGKGKDVDWNKRREEVKKVFQQSWQAYENAAWGYDEFHPVKRTGRNMAPKGLGWIIVDSLDTLMIMNLTSELAHARQWVKNSLTWEQNQDVNTFETTIRMLGGLLSAYYLQTELKMVPLEDNDADLYLEKATDLGDRLLGAYRSKSGIPYASVNLKTMEGIQSHADGGASSTAEATTTQLEMKYLSKLVGDKVYWKAAEKVMEVIDGLKPKDGLVPIFIHPDSGSFYGREIRLGSRGDSYYEYLLKQYLQTNQQEPIYEEMYLESMEGVKKHLVQHSLPSHLTYIAELPDGVGGRLHPKMDHLVCFMGGNFALGATLGVPLEIARRDWGGRKWSSRREEDIRLARELTHTCYQMYNVTATGLAPEIAFFNTEEISGQTRGDTSKDIKIKPQDAHNLQRPETVESLFIMYRITGDEIYRQWGWEIFEAFRKHTAVANGDLGYSSINNVNEIPAPFRDNMESFWLAETLKYLYLLFSENTLLPLDKVVFNTEAHPLPKFDMGEFKTGWTRKAAERKVEKKSVESEKVEKKE